MSGFTTTPFPLTIPEGFGNRIFYPIENPLSKEGVFLGRTLFYETRLSSNGKISCESCHQQHKAFTDGKSFSIGVDNQPTSRNAMSLVNLLWSKRFFWDGRSSTLEDQAVFPLTNPHEMGQSLEKSSQLLKELPAYRALFKEAFGDDLVTPHRITMALAQFERTLISSNSRYDQYLIKKYEPSKAEQNGMLLFNQSPQPAKGIRGANCAHCHGGIKMYKELFHNNGLDRNPIDIGIESLTGSKLDRGRFKAPTLRNIALTAPYMHDGRFNTLEEVIEHYSEHIAQSNALSSFLQNESNVIGGKSLKLSTVEKKELLAFLNMLTDSSFITNPDYSNPQQTSINK